jgi:hypothetical protein
MDEDRLLDGRHAIEEAMSESVHSAGIKFVVDDA